MGSIFQDRQRIIERLGAPSLSRLATTSSVVQEFEKDALFSAVLKQAGFDLHNYLSGAYWPKSILQLAHVHTRPHVSISALAAKAADDPRIVEQVISAFLEGYSEFFRGSEEQWGTVRSFIQKHAQTPLRILSLGCSGGEEPLTVAMLCQEAASVSAHIEGWDRSSDALLHAHAALYSPKTANQVGAERCVKYFTQIPVLNVLYYAANENIRSSVRYKQRDVLADIPPHDEEGFNIVICKNLKQHLIPHQRSEIDLRAAHLTRPGGIYVTDRHFPPLRPNFFSLKAIETAGVYLKS